jgi:hypothetical protein
MNYEEIQKAVGNAAAIFKLVCGAGAGCCALRTHSIL